jgi:4-amino-4-deoxy-L-arabinose transferase-like glycosyltransferase
MAIAATYPFLARQAGFVMSDHLHAALVLFGLAPLVLVRPGWWRGLAVGLLLAAATLTRPYSFVCLPLVIGALVWKREDDRWLHDVLGVCVGLALPMGTWIVRNSIVYGRFIPFTLSGLGTALYLNKIVWTVGDLYDPDNVRMTINEINRVAGADANSWQGNRALTEAALAWMRAHPLQVLASLPWRVVRMWINVGTSGVGVSRAWPLIGGYLGGLLAAGTAGMAYARKVRRLVPLVLFVLAYWAFLLHTPADARRTLPLRLPMLLFAGLAVDALWKGRVGAWLRSTSLARRFGTLVGATPQGKV